MAKSKEFIEMLAEQSWVYIEECINKTKQTANNKGGVTDVKDRYIPTIDYFLRIWMPLNNKETIVRNTWYDWLNGEDKLKKDTIKKINENFNALASDVVANEGRGIFYAKNKLGWTDKTESTNITPPIFPDLD